MPGNQLVFPAEGVESATAYTLTATPSRIYSTTVDFDVIGVREGHRFEFTSGLFNGLSFPVKSVAAGSPSHLELGEQFEVVTAETGITFEIGAAAQGTARCYFKSPMRVVFDPAFRITIGNGQVYMPDPDTSTTIFEEDTADTDLEIENLSPLPTGVDGTIAAGFPTTTFTVSGTPFVASDVGKFLHIVGPAADPNIGTYQIAAVPAANQLTVVAPGLPGPASTVLQWAIHPTATTWTALTSALATNDWAVRYIKENSEVDMGVRADSDLVYIDHMDIFSTALAATLTPLAGTTLIININGADATYTFTTNSIAYTALPQYIEAAFPSVGAKIYEDLSAPGTYRLHLFSSDDLVIGTGTANGVLQLTAGQTNVVDAIQRGPFQIGWNGVGVESGSPPIKAANKAVVRLVQLGTDDPMPIGSLAGHRIHARIVRAGTQIFEEEDLTAYGGYYYADLDISSYYPGPDQILREETAATTVTGIRSNGFTYVADQDHSYSVIEDLKIYCDGIFSAKEYPTPVLGTNAQVTYKYAPEVETAHYFMQNKGERTVTCNTLAKVSVPLEVTVRFTYRGSTSLEAAKNAVIDYFRTLPHGTLFTVREFTSAMRAKGVLVNNTPTILVIEPDTSRQFRLYKVTEEYQIADSAAFLAVSTVLTKG